MSKFKVWAFAAFLILIGTPARAAGFVWTLIAIGFEAGGDDALAMCEQLEEPKP